jgi:holliday junction DNA helicase RuvA
MIACLRGKILDASTPGRIVMDVHGVGYDVETSLNTFFKLESHREDFLLYIQTIVREDAFLLYGFIDKEERALFRALIKVNGVGPKMAIAILSSANPVDFVRCVQQENVALLTKIPGIGKKTAERLIVEMKDSLKQLFDKDEIQGQALSVGHTHSLHQQHEAVSALEALGYRSNEALKVIRQIDDGEKNVEQLIRQALQLLSRLTV